MQLRGFLTSRGTIHIDRECHSCKNPLMVWFRKDELDDSRVCTDCRRRFKRREKIEELN